jgi:hypothetical protein
LLVFPLPLILIALVSRLALVAVGSGLRLCLLASPLLSLILITLTGRLLPLVGGGFRLCLFALALFGPIVSSFGSLLGTWCSLVLGAIALAAGRHLLSG